MWPKPARRWVHDLEFVQGRMTGNRRTVHGIRAEVLDGGSGQCGRVDRGILLGRQPCFPFSWWYLHGITPGDFLFLGYLRDRVPFRAAWFPGSETASLIFADTPWSWLCSRYGCFRRPWSISVRYGCILPEHPRGPEALLTYLTGYWFCVAAFVERNGYGKLLAFFPFWNTVCWRGDLFLVAPAISRMRVDGLVLLKDPNVIGNLLGIGTFMASLLDSCADAILQPACISSGFPVLSVFTFSKGAWLLVALSLVANAVAYAIGRARDLRPDATGASIHGGYRCLSGRAGCVEAFGT